MRRLIIALVALSLAAQGRTQERQRFEPAPPVLALVESDQQALVQEAFAKLDDPEASLEQRLESLREWCAQKRFFYAQIDGYHLLISAQVLIAESPTWARLEVLRLLRETLETGQPLEVHRLPPTTRRAVIATIERGDLAVFSGFAEMFRGEAYMVLGARLVAEWTAPDGSVKTSQFGAPLHSLEALLSKPPARVPPLRTRLPMRKLLYTTPPLHLRRSRVE
jgi:hypothetical protein